MIDPLYHYQGRRGQSAARWFQTLCLYLGEPDLEEQVGLQEAADLIARGEVTLAEVEAALAEGWEPAQESLLDYLSLQEEEEDWFETERELGELAALDRLEKRGEVEALAELEALDELDEDEEA